MFQCAPDLYLRDFHYTTVMENKLNADDYSNNYLVSGLSGKRIAKSQFCVMMDIASLFNLILVELLLNQNNKMYFASHNILH